MVGSGDDDKRLGTRRPPLVKADDDEPKPSDQRHKKSCGSTVRTEAVIIRENRDPRHFLARFSTIEARLGSILWRWSRLLAGASDGSPGV
ncbi:hypothetical protein Dimus_016137, partial [Dionaea muscipula]